uniref:NADH dehydrogenase subunit 6 n=1 Tax=Choeras grammatitergitus TaxID=1911502 RepID=A0A6F8AST2_9HYME|nr:NADH dehydrogenase subunit 6 [Choeras grammatitergitus]
MNMNFFYMNYYIMDFLMILIIFIPSNLMKFHPLIFSMLLLMYMIILSFKLNYLLSNFWYSYILFLLMVGGVMILIMYLTSISNNEMFNYSFIMIYYNLMKFIFFYMIFIMFMYMYMNNYLNMNMNFYDLNSFKLNFKENNFLILKNLYMNMNMEMIIYFIIYLLLMMMFSTMICLKFNIPMRQMIF